MISDETTSPYKVVWSYHKKVAVMCKVMLLLVGDREMMSWAHDGKRQTVLLDKSVLYETKAEAWKGFHDSVDELPKNVLKHALKEYCLRMYRECESKGE